MFKFSCADFTFPVVDRSAALRLVKLLGFDYVDIGLFARSAHFSPFDLEAAPKEYTARVMHDLQEAQLQAADVFVQFGDDPAERAANDPSFKIRNMNREIFSRTVEFCHRLGCRHMTGLPGVFHAGTEAEADLELAAAETHWRITECASTSIQYAIEPHVGSICGAVEPTQQFLRAVDGLTLTLDYGHFVMSGESSAAVHQLLPFASHIHVRGGAKDRLQTSVDENEIDFAGMLAGLTRTGFTGFLTLEYVWIDWNGCNRTDNVSETILLRKHVQSALSALNGGIMRV